MTLCLIYSKYISSDKTPFPAVFTACFSFFTTMLQISCRMMEFQTKLFLERILPKKSFGLSWGSQKQIGKHEGLIESVYFSQNFNPEFLRWGLWETLSYSGGHDDVHSRNWSITTVIIALNEWFVGRGKIRNVKLQTQCDNWEGHRFN